MCWYGTKILVVVLGNIHILCAFGLLGESNPSLSVSFEEHDLQDLEKIALVRTEKSQSPLDLHHRRPRHKICSIFILTEVGLATCGAYCPGTKARLITPRPTDTFARKYFDGRHDVQRVAQQKCTSCQSKMKCVVSFVCESEMSEVKVRLCR